MNYFSCYYSPSDATFTPEFDYDKDFATVTNITQNGFVVTGLKEGQTVITVSAGGKSAAIIAKFEGYSDSYNANVAPYIYSKTSILQLTPGNSERINVSLYNGTVSDNQNYSWTIENPSIAELSENGQYCVVKANTEGYSRIKVTNSAAAYPYYIGVYVLQEFTNTTYITCKDNIKTVYVDKGSSKVSVDLVNPKSDTYKQKFSWQILDGDTDCVSILANNDECTITPVKAGQCTLRVTNEEADSNLPFDIIIRSVEIVDSAYIEPSQTVVTITDSTTEYTVTAQIAGLTEEKDYSASDFDWEVEDDSYFSYWTFGNQITFTGKHNGATSVYVSHPKVQKKRQILVILENQTADAVDASCYITTTQNFIKTKVGADETELQVSLRGGGDGDEKRFRWDILQQPDDGASDVISVTTTNGNEFSSLRSARSAAQTFSYGTLYIKPLAEGTATITVSHPKSYYTTEILVKVLNEGAVLEDPLYFTGSGIVKFLNSETAEYTVALNGKSKAASDEADIGWKSNSDGLVVNGNGTQAELSSTSAGSLVRSMTISHPKTTAPKDVLVLTADTQEELDAIKAFYSDKTYYSVNAGKTASIYVQSVGFTDSDGEELDFSEITGVTWTSSNPEIFTVEKQAGNPLCGVVTGVKAGKGTAAIKYGDTSATFNVTVYPENVNLDEVEPSVYFTTARNVIVIGEAGGTATASVTAIGLSSKEKGNIEWKSSDESVATVVGNGESAAVTAVKDGQAVLTVSHPLSENTLKIYVKTGSEYVTEKSGLKYITANSDTIAITKDSDAFTLKAYLANGTNEENMSGFSFEIEDESVAKFSAAYSSGTAYVKAAAAGQTEITISHEKSSLKKKVLVVVANTAEELSAFKFLTTSQNVVTLAEGGSKSISVSIANAAETVLDGYTWTTSNAAVAGISATTSSTAVIVGNGAGTAKVTVTNTACKYPLEIIVQVVDASAAASTPYIQATASVLELKVSDTFTTVTAELVGGRETDAIDFEWTSDDKSVIEAYGQNGVGKVRAVAAGLTYLHVFHPKAPYDQLVLCICSVQTASECSISVSSGNIMSIKPDSGEQTITASLVNGSASDKYNFTWSLDVYDVVDMTYAANTAIITPLKAGVAQLTIHHPKSPYDQTVVIKVQQYSDFAFGAKTKTVESGSTTYVSMEVPSSSVATTVVYEVDDPTVCTVQGTNAVCAITGKKAGATAVVHAKMMAGTTVYAETSVDLLVNVTAAAEESAYISGNSTIYTMDVGNSRTFSASLVGTDHPETDVYSLQWETGNPSVLSLAGATRNADGKYVVTGSSCYGTAKASGETTLTVSYKGIAINLVYHVIVAAEGEKDITLSKSYVSIEKNKSSEVKAKIDGGETADYKAITWEADKTNGAEIVRILGSGQTVSVYGVSAGTTYLYATTSDGKTAKCQVVVTEAKTLSFVNSTVRVQPLHTRTVQYTMTPSDATLTWQIMDASVEGKECFSITNLGLTDSEKGTGQLQIEGIAETGGSVPVTFVNSYGKTATLNIKVAWEYDFSLTRTPKIDGKPEGTYKIGYTVCPSNSVFSGLDDWECASVAEVVTEKNDERREGYFEITPKTETNSSGETHTITAANPAVKNATVGAQSITLKFKYPKLTPIVSLASSNGNFSRYDEAANTLYLGDGETANFSVSIAEKNSNATIESVIPYGSQINSVGIVSSGEKSFICNISSPESDSVSHEYLINKAYVPYVGGAELSDWETAFTWWAADCKHSNAHDCLTFAQIYSSNNRSFNYNGYRDGRNSSLLVWMQQNWAYRAIGRDDGEWDFGHFSGSSPSYTKNSSFSIKEKTSLRGKIYQEKDFQRIGWFYCPGTRTGAGEVWLRAPNRGYKCSIDNVPGCSSLDDAEGWSMQVFPSVLTDVVDATCRESTDKTVKNVSDYGRIRVTINHSGSNEYVEILVVGETRSCPMTQR